MSAATMSVLCADISGSARLFERLPEGEVFYALERCIKRMERVVDVFSGKVIQSSKSELVALFDKAEEACQAAIDMQQRVEDLPPISGVKHSIRVAFHCGPVAMGGEGISGAGFDGAAKLVGMAKAGQILLSAEAVNALSQNLRTSSKAIDRQLIGNGGETTAVYELPWAESGDITALQLRSVGVDTAKLSAARELPKLCVRHSGKAFLLDGKNEGLSFGRDGACDVVIQDKRASRSHARILRRRDRYVLVDESTNGTYVAFEGEPEMFVRHSEVVLGNKGLLAFGHSATGGDAEVAEFEYL